MISFLRGVLHSKQVTGGPVDRLTVDVGGVGFELLVARTTLASCGQSGDDITIFTALSIRENDWQMFGFASLSEKEMFHLLQSVSGVGPKLALGLVGTLGPEQIAAAVTTEDQKLLSAAPGVGAKVAQRIILELKGKMQEWQMQAGQTLAPGLTGNHTRQEARAILEGLGYTLTEINAAFKETDTVHDEDVELLVRHSLKVLGAAGR